MAEAFVEERQLLKSMHWYDGFVIALCNPGFLISSLGFTLSTVGALGSVILWGTSALVGLLQNWIYSESATMFPDKSGGIAMYAHEGWRKYFNLAGPIAAFGYWIGWSVVLSLFGNLIGVLVVAQWFPSLGDIVYYDTGTRAVGPAQIIGIGLVIGVWLFNIFGVEATLRVAYVTGALLIDPALHLHSAPLSHRRLAVIQHRLCRRGGFQQARGGLDVAVHHVLVGLRNRGLCQLRSRVPQHEARHLLGPEVVSRLLALRLHIRPPGTGRSCGHHRGCRYFLCGCF